MYKTKIYLLCIEASFWAKEGVEQHSHLSVTILLRSFELQHKHTKKLVTYIHCID